MLEAHYIPHNHVLKVWGEVEPLISKALKYNYADVTSADALNLILNQGFKLWIGADGNEIQSALLAEFVQYPRKKAMRIVTWATKSGQDYESWMELFDKIEDFAKHNGCSLIEAWARKGLAKKLNWEHSYSVVSKNI